MFVFHILKIFMFTHSRLKRNWKPNDFPLYIALYDGQHLPIIYISRKFSRTFMLLKNISRNLSRSFMSFKEYFSEIFHNLQAFKIRFCVNSLIPSCLQKKILRNFLELSKSIFCKLSGSFLSWEEYFLQKFLVIFTFGKKITIFLCCGTRCFMDCKEYFHGNFPVISCL